LLQLQYLNLGSNQLSGSIPTALGDLPYLQELILYYNKLTGGVLSNWMQQPPIQVLSLDGNELTGMIPTTLGNLSKLQALTLSQNQLTGSIPSSLGGLAQLSVLSLSGNHLSGGIPAGLTDLRQLSYLDLSMNQLSGAVPDFANLVGASIDLASNYFNVVAGSPSLATIQAMINAGNAVTYLPQETLPLSVGPNILFSNGTAQIDLTGLPGQTYTVQASSDLENWSYVTVVTLTNGGALFLDPAATNYSHRFYRAFLNP
jgi:Leucine-rich repeat (LRR) protein